MSETAYKIAEDYARATGHASAMFSWIDLILRNPSDSPQRDLDEIKRYLDREVPNLRRRSEGER